MPYLEIMPAMVADAQDRFSELFGNKRGADRPDEDVAFSADELKAGVPCAGGCGTRVVPVSSEDCGAQSGPWYCDRCFTLERKKLEARRGTPPRGAVADPASTEDELLMEALQKGPRVPPILAPTVIGAIILVAAVALAALYIIELLH